MEQDIDISQEKKKIFKKIADFEACTVKHK